jgi:hypothetical protein
VTARQAISGRLGSVFKFLQNEQPCHRFGSFWTFLKCSLTLLQSFPERFTLAYTKEPLRGSHPCKFEAKPLTESYQTRAIPQCHFRTIPKSLRSPKQPKSGPPDHPTLPPRDTTNTKSTLKSALLSQDKLTARIISQNRVGVRECEDMARGTLSASGSVRVTD